MLGLQAKPDGGLKDTSAHIRDRGEFVVNLVDEALGEQMNMCAIDFPPEVSEIDAAKLSLLPSAEGRRSPRIAEAPAALECRHYTTLEVEPAAPPRDRRGRACPCARGPVGHREDAQST